MRIVCDSSAIIALERIKHLWILEKLAEEIFIPPAVNKEIMSKKNFNLPSCFKIKAAENKFYVEEHRQHLHMGEIEAIALAREIKADLIILDDKMARKFAEKEGLRVSGLLALLIKAKEKGIVKQIKPIVDALKVNGFFVREDVYAEIMKLSDER